MTGLFQTDITFGREVLVFGAGEMVVDSFLEELHIFGVLFAEYRTAQKVGQIQGTNEEEEKNRVMIIQGNQNQTSAIPKIQYNCLIMRNIVN